MPEHAAALEDNYIAGGGLGSAAYRKKIRKNAHPDQHVSEMDSGEHEIEHEKVVCHEGDAGTNLFAIFEELDAAEAGAANQGQRKQTGSVFAYTLARSVDSCRDKPGAGEQQQRIDQAEGLVQRPVGFGVERRILISVVSEGEEKKSENHQIAENEYPHSGLSGQAPGRHRRNGFCNAIGGAAGLDIHGSAGLLAQQLSLAAFPARWLSAWETSW